MEKIMEFTMETGLLSKKSIWSGRVISGIVVLFLLFDSITKILLLDFVVKASAPLGFSVSDLRIIGLILLLCTIIYINPRTSVLGAILLTGYLGGAVVTNLRMNAPLFNNILFPAYFGILVWAGLYLRNSRLRNLFPIIGNRSDLVTK